MSEDLLKAHIAEVRKQMQTALNGKERDLLGDLMTAIAEGKHEQPQSELDEKAVAFESDHPKLARALREVMDVLNKMGI